MDDERHDERPRDLPAVVESRRLVPGSPHGRNLPQRLRKVASNPVVAASLATAATLAVQAGARALLPRTLAGLMPAVRPGVGRSISPADLRTATIVTRTVVVETVQVHTREK